MINRCVLLVATTLLLASCSDDEAAAPLEPRATPITTIDVSLTQIQVIEKATGYIETKAAPSTAAEVAGQVIRIEADIGARVQQGQLLATIDPTDYENQLRSRQGEVDRIQTLIDNQQRRVKRFRSLLDDAFVSDNSLEDEEATLKALQRQLTTVKAQRDIAARDLQKCEIRSPVDGQIQGREITVGSYVKKGDPAFQVADSRRLRVHLPFPETVMQQLNAGQRVRLDTPASDGRVVEGKISELRPMVDPASRAGEVVIDINNPGSWFPGTSVNGAVILATRTSVTVPKIALALRPAGQVVYVIEKNRARQRVVNVGEYQNGQVEILAGLTAGETVAVDGAAYLSDGALVKVATLSPSSEQPLAE
ncbi:MAG: efflux RND transporter periplasmic adaptor subunit [Gammaproteobacteria bacterium]